MPIVLLAFLLFPAIAYSNPLQETRYCNVMPSRDVDGSISRRADVLRAFRKTHPCPATKSTFGPCLGWAMDHVIPLANGGCDSVNNLQWLPSAIKSCPGTICKDRWERNVYLRGNQ